MARKITRKNFYMEIRRNFGRFISILFIVALGVLFWNPGIGTIYENYGRCVF